MIRHIVAWNCQAQFSVEEKHQNLEKIKADLENLTQFIPQIKAIQVIIDPIKTGNRDAILVSLFDNELALEEYQNHPAHKKVSKFVGSVMQDRVCLDYCE